MTVKRLHHWQMLMQISQLGSTALMTRQVSGAESGSHSIGLNYSVTALWIN